jgi:hypothetical protein
MSYAMISSCSEARDRITNRSEWSSETTTDATSGGYRRRLAEKASNFG